MKIEHSDVSFFSSHKKDHEIKEEENLHMWNSDDEAPQRLQAGDRLELSEKINSLDEDMFDMPLDAKLMSIIRALEMLTGKKINISFYRDAKAQDIDVPVQHQEDSVETERLGWGIEYSYNRSEITKEKLSFSAKGNVETEDGRKIDFKLALKMKRESVVQESLSFKAGDALIDPLVINFDSATVTMSDIKHNFDLNLDGKNNEFSFVGNGSGFLALDKNGDGVINDGSELFGPTLGNGFEELSAYDTDNNMWIDENDAVFEKLFIWTKDEDGTQNLFSLKDKNVGALYLDRVNTEFDLEDGSNNLLAKMRESSVFLKEDGGVGTIQEVDLKV